MQSGSLIGQAFMDLHSSKAAMVRGRARAAKFMARAVATLPMLLALVASGIPGALATSRSLLQVPTAPVGPIEAIFIFGDSDADAGNPPFLGISTADYPPYGINYIPSSGRFSDGPLIMDYIAAYMKMPPQPPSQSPMAKTLEGARYGVNFAYAGGGTLNTTSLFNTFTLTYQLGEFQALRARVLRQPRSSVFPPERFSKALYVLSFGGVDYLNVLQPNLEAVQELLGGPRFNITQGQGGFSRSRNGGPSGGAAASVLPPPADVDVTAGVNASASALDTVVSSAGVAFTVVRDIWVAVQNVVAALVGAMRILHSLGARHFLVFGMPATGCLPAAVAAVNGSECVGILNIIGQLHQFELSNALDTLRSELPDADFLFANTFQVMSAAASEPQRYGFKHGVGCCCGGPPHLTAVYQCGSGRSWVPNMADLSGPANRTYMCRNASDYVFWDGAHTSGAWNKLYADGIWGGTAEVVTPTNVRDLLQRLSQ